MGFLSVSSEVDIELLNSLYQLEPFHCLKKPQQSDEVQSVSTYGEHLVTILYRNVYAVSTYSTLVILTCNVFRVICVHVHVHVYLQSLHSRLLPIYI